MTTVKKIFLMNSPELPTSGTHMFTTSKFLSSFTYYGYEVFIANKLDDIVNGSIVLLSSHGIDHWNGCYKLSRYYISRLCIFMLVLSSLLSFDSI
jgi:hypothetical protein